MQQGRLVLEGGLVLDSDLMQFRQADLLLEAGMIAAVGVPGDFATIDAISVSARDRLVIPGLVNAHGHGHGYFAKGLNPEWPVELLIAASGWITANRDLETMRLSALVGAAEMLTKGCTTAVDLYSQLPLPTGDVFAAVASAYRDIGMRATIGPMIADIPFWRATPGLMHFLTAEGASVNAPPAMNTDMLIGSVCDAMDSLPNDEWIKPTLCAAIPLSCTDTLLDRLVSLAGERGVVLHTHYLESSLQGPFWTQSRGQPLTEALDARGMLSDRFVAAHAIWLEDRELDILAHRGVMIAHNPLSNMRLGTGIAPVRKMVAKGMTVGLGTDTCSCADNLNMFEAMRCAAGLSRVVEPDGRKWLTAGDVFRAATVGSARIADRHNEIGKLAVGFRADLVLLDLGKPHYLPLNDPLTQIVHAEDGTGIDRVFVGGREVVRNGQLLDFDIQAARGSIADANRRYLETNAPARDNFNHLAPLVARFRLREVRRLWHSE